MLFYVPCFSQRVLEDHEQILCKYVNKLVLSSKWMFLFVPTKGLCYLIEIKLNLIFQVNMMSAADHSLLRSVTTLCPLDGRYLAKVNDLTPFTSEFVYERIWPY